jgi:uncharacterized membrane protein
MEESGNRKSGLQNPEGKEREMVTTQQVVFSGPLPPPAILKGYEDIVPGAADRIIAMAEKQSGHRQRIESIVLKSDELKSILGLVFAFLIVLAAFVTGAYTALQGRPLFGSVISLAGLAAVVGPFIYQRQREQGKGK